MPPLSKKDFKKLPQWDFEDVYNQDAPPRQTTCAQSLRNSQDESFRKAFLPNIRLFLHKDNINMSEWNRLSHFNNPFGFMEYKYDGRMNGAAITGYEEDVGSRTSVYVHTAHSITTSLYVFRKYGYISAPHDESIKYVLIPEGMRDFNWLEGLIKGERVAGGPYINRRPRTYYSGQYNESRFYVLHQDFLRYVRNRFIKSPNLNATSWAIVRPTNGAFALFLALHTCDTVS
ncbi:alpha-N-acetylgalactosaminide alpha-2,6-sialyltransferase 2-like protein [Lates japonicus]|uniref:alpha-N-acetylgalactosaminide alpha-2,6-sialyltransferase n=1 Tax=Lates japonicus TaxID=270547 RepID=A0AAD3NAJ4_LATJO|nr:alpha-N-acetylgalactosaminide alpha-2,6-sialyltransferase 2-like protein [Lates japonicus]